MSRPQLPNVVAASLGTASVLPLAAVASQGAEITSTTADEVVFMLAYIDPGVAGFVIVSILGFISSVGYLARSYIGKVKQRLFGRGEADDDESGAEEDADGETANR